MNATGLNNTVCAWYFCTCITALIAPATLNYFAAGIVPVLLCIVERLHTSVAKKSHPSMTIFEVDRYIHVLQMPSIMSTHGD